MALLIAATPQVCLTKGALSCDRSQVLRKCNRPFQSTRRGGVVVAAAAGPSADRRSILLAGAALLAAPMLTEAASAGTITVDNLSGFQKADQRSAFQKRVAAELKKVITKDDAALATLAIINDAGTYNFADGSGGFNGSLRLELDRPENQVLKPYFDKLAAAKKPIDEKNDKQGLPPISWADLEVAAVKLANRQLWLDIKTQRASIAAGGSTIAENFGSPWDIVLGRKDSDTPDAEGRVLKAGASAEEVKAWFQSLAAPAGGGPFGGKSKFWPRVSYVLWDAAHPEADEQLGADPEFATWKKKYDRSKGTVTRTEYEVDFAEFTDRLTNLGTTPLANAYLQPMITQDLRL
eukprot:CAMPEP_0206144858 /NCGR_PEP_ID=MMETSP1473-20131121/25656_1 /ASSEMBLY_ACC=CAM_ASM_001109 /TAXON_ID=1461547 /ORGANISM="Stichococcus sp, Strain RCC1054" /LENGTH=349 /DNA_ID=CAMNT_0053540851 /DNA_START=116 /DNA_END=1165 /DNA_ORIENTATION=-